ncbi:M28 family peptidase [Pendulispora rubella]|uniref:M28 family peptidase n=1 Tax=Pendulispora rubella TaxID=2741070 RepID=A0ABZ2KX99_9BACT
MQKRTTLLLALSIGAGLWACSEAAPREGTSTHSLALADDSDPMEHITYLSSDAMKGRNSPSAQFDEAAKYVTDRLVKYGLKGPNEGDANGAYAQTFTQSSFAENSVANGAPHDEAAHARNFGNTLFERSFYLDEHMDPEAFRVVAGKSGRGENASFSDVRSAAVDAAGNTHNVLGLLEGTGAKKQEIIVVMSHLDHIGTTSSGQVNNGADDNASGSGTNLAAVPALAQAKANGELNRSVLFIWTAAEEDGLVGSKYFVDHPIANIGLGNIVGVINSDMVGRWDAQRISVIDKKSDGTTSYLAGLLTQANAKLASPFDTINHDINQYARRQDGASFYDKGEDVLFLFEGLSNPAGGGDLNPDYHAPGDDVSKILDDNNGDKPRKIRDLVIELVKLAVNR